MIWWWTIRSRQVINIWNTILRKKNRYFLICRQVNHTNCKLRFNVNQGMINDVGLDSEIKWHPQSTQVLESHTINYFNTFANVNDKLYSASHCRSDINPHPRVTTVNKNGINHFFRRLAQPVFIQSVAEKVSYSYHVTKDTRQIKKWFHASG